MTDSKGTRSGAMDSRRSEGQRKYGIGATTTQREEDMRRARIEVMASAGVGYGRISIEALYLLPTEFTQAYVRMFEQALKEGPSGGGSGDKNPLVGARDRPKLTRGTGRGDRPPGVALDMDPSKGKGAASGGGKRHREHWTIRDERALRLKGRIDRELLGLVEEIRLGMKRSGEKSSSRAAGEGSGPDSSQCTGATCRRMMKTGWTWCPWCGQQKTEDQERGDSRERR